MISTIQSFFMPSIPKITINTDTSDAFKDNKPNWEGCNFELYRKCIGMGEKILGTKIIKSTAIWLMQQNIAEKSNSLETRILSDMISEMPTCVALVDSIPKINEYVKNPLAPYKLEGLTEEQKDKLTVSLETPWKVQEVRDLCLRIGELLKINSILSEIYDKFPSLDRKKFEDISAKLIPLSIQALKECLYQHVVLKHLKQMTEGCFNEALKEDWKSERWWLNKIFKLRLLDAEKDITYDQRAEFQKLFQLYNEHVAQLFKSQEKINKNFTGCISENKDRAINESLPLRTFKIYLLAIDAMRQYQ